MDGGGPKRFLFPFKLFLSMKTSHTSYTSWNVNVNRISHTGAPVIKAIAERQLKNLIFFGSLYRTIYSGTTAKNWFSSVPCTEPFTA